MEKLLFLAGDVSPKTTSSDNVDPGVAVRGMLALGTATTVDEDDGPAADAAIGSEGFELSSASKAACSALSLSIFFRRACALRSFTLASKAAASSRRLLSVASAISSIIPAD